ncbi:unnamed protein product [Phytophthora fragariaefolia]|uniref:Unnamed protein product n=1 Tax=Phytophthora fragariaefolia TaxID=1490495 RepID=A0A9W6U5I0_9STRA|nr:unnamed protein product [Phytophthora fragariaefolia]
MTISPPGPDNSFAPAVTKTDPLVLTVPLVPTLRLIEPLFPFCDAPVVILASPLWIFFEIPLVTVTEPLAKLSAESADDNEADPLKPALLTPLETTKLPPAPALPEPPDTVILPPSKFPAPPTKEIRPPTPTPAKLVSKPLLTPPRIRTLPPVLESPDPTSKLMSPAAPFVAPDVTMLTAPELPLTDTPVDSEIDPLA